MSGEDIKQEILLVLERESGALRDLIENFPQEAISFVEEIVKTDGRLVFSGMGKSGHIGRKLVATFSSMGTPSLFLHPAEALHGDLGMIMPNDFFVALSKSGTGSELNQIIKILSMQGNKTALICCRDGLLGSIADLVVKLPLEREACNMNLAPTSSSTVMIAFGDAVCVAVSKLIGFQKHDFARTHPCGALGKQLLATVDSFLCKSDDLPFVTLSDSFQSVIVTATEKKFGVAIVVDEEKNLRGIITDGDLRRACELGPNLFDKTAKEIMSADPKTISAGIKAYDALKIMERYNITSLLVVDDRNSDSVGKKVVGLVHIHDLVKAGIKT